MAVISQLSVSLKADTRKLTKGFKRAKREVSKFTNSVFSMKNAVVGALGVGGVGAALSMSISKWREQEQAVASLDSSIQAMGRGTGNLSSEMQKLASDLQKEGVIGDEAIIQGMSFLTTYSQITNDVLPRASRVMVDLMAKTGRSGAAAANMIGKAAMGLTGALSIAGITLSDTTKSAADNLKKMKAEAQKNGLSLSFAGAEARVFKMILSDMESQIGGTNRALAATDTGAIDKLGNSLGDLQEQLGKIASSAIGKWVRQLSMDIDNMNLDVDELSDSFQKWLYESALAAAPLVESLKGIQLAIKSIGLGFRGALLLATKQMAEFIRPANEISKLFGGDFGGNLLGFLDQSVNSQLSSIETAKKEIGALFDEISSQSFTTQLENKLKEFDRRATATDQAAKDAVKPPVVTPEKLGSLDKLIINPGRANEKVIIDSPQLSETNKVLHQMKNFLQRETVAVAG